MGRHGQIEAREPCRLKGIYNEKELQWEDSGEC